MSIPSTARAAIFRGTERGFDVIEQPVPETGSGRVLIRTELTGICGTDMHLYDVGTPAPMALGHEICGVVVAAGDGLETDFTGRPLAVGDRVVPHPGTPSGAYGFRSDPANGEPFLTGGFGEYVALHYPDSAYFKVDAPAEAAVLLEPFSVAIHGVERSHIRPGDTVVVQGTGAIGLLTIFAASRAGAVKVIAVGGPKGRLEMAAALGADDLIDIAEYPTSAERVAAVLALTPKGLGADVVFECAGVKSAITEGIDMLRRSGTFCELGHFVDTGEMTINPNKHLVLKDLNLVAPYGSHREHFVRARALLEKNAELLGGLVSHRVPLSRMDDALGALLGRYHLDGVDAVKIAVDPWRA